MPQNKVTILSTRAIEEALLAEAVSKNIIVDTIPFIKTEPTSSIETQQEIEHLATMQVTVVFTSVNAVEAVAAELESYQPDWQIFCMGHATREAVEELFDKSSIAGTAVNAQELANAVIKKGDIDEVIFFCGDQRRNELMDTLRAADIEFSEVIVYQTTLVPQKVDKTYDGILFFSPSAVKSFFQKNRPTDQTVLFAIGGTTASEIKHYSNNKIIVSSRPDKNHLMKKVIAFFDEDPSRLRSGQH
jgi:uroporphyrinogen-III synthase